MASANPLFSFESPDDSPGFLLWQATNLWQREFKKALERFDLTHAQFVALASAYWLSQHQPPVTQAALAAHARMDKMMASKVLRTLEAKGLLARPDSTHDTRAKAIELTSIGTKTLVQAVWAVEEFDAKFFGVLGQEQAAFSQQLKALLAAAGAAPAA